MTSVTDEDLFAAPPREDEGAQSDAQDPAPASRRVLVVVRGLILAVLAGGFALLLWQVYSGGGDAPSVGPVPILRADPTPVRLDIDPQVVPNEGGMDIPFRDMLIMRRSAEVVQPLLDRVVLAPAPEAPLPVPGAPGGPTSARPGDEPEYLLRREPEAVPELDDTALSDLLVAESPPPAAPRPAPSEPTSTPAPTADPIGGLLSGAGDDVEADERPLLAEPEAEPAPPPAAEPAPVTAGTHAVQLGALSNPAAAQGEVDRLRRRFASLLGEAEIAIVPPAGGSGLTRIVAIGFGEQGARELCTGLRQRGGDCFVRDAP